MPDYVPIQDLTLKSSLVDTDYIPVSDGLTAFAIRAETFKNYAGIDKAIVVHDSVVITNFDADNAGNQKLYKIQTTSSSTVLHLPSDAYDNSPWFLVTITNGAAKQQYLWNYTFTKVYSRYYFQSWAAWTGVVLSGNISNSEQVVVSNFDANNAADNSIVKFQYISSMSQNVQNIPQRALDGSPWFLITLFNKYNSNVQRQQYLYKYDMSCTCARYQFAGSWSDWSYKDNVTQSTIECGPGRQYTTFRSAIAAAVSAGNTKVIVYAGVYDLATEFSDVLSAQSGTGVQLGNNVHVVFMPGAKVTCLLDGSNTWAHSNFEPFKALSGDFILENADIRCSNTRYCVHDEQAGQAVNYHHQYINCHMEQSDTLANALYAQCIGGGLGEHGYIEIKGGYYKSSATYYNQHYTSPDDMQQPISFHNGDIATAYSQIYIRDVYLADKGYLRFGNYGPSTNLSPVEVSGCRMYKSVYLMNETWSSSQVTNFEIIAFNNEVVSS